jgi:hypothetical protein
VALTNFDTSERDDRPSARVVSADETMVAARRIGARSDHPHHDVSLFYILFAWPLEVARPEVRDYLAEDGAVRRIGDSS